VEWSEEQGSEEGGWKDLREKGGTEDGKQMIDCLTRTFQPSFHTQQTNTSNDREAGFGGYADLRPGLDARGQRRRHVLVSV